MAGKAEFTTVIESVTFTSAKHLVTPKLKMPHGVVYHRLVTDMERAGYQLIGITDGNGSSISIFTDADSGTVAIDVRLCGMEKKAVLEKRARDMAEELEERWPKK